VTVELEHRYRPRGAARTLLTCRDPEILISGPAGTGKSLSCLTKLMLVCLQVPNAKALVVRKTQVSIANSAAATWEKLVIPHLLATGYVRFFGGSPRKPPAYLFRNGSIVGLGGMDKPSRIMSTEWDLIYGQEATELTLDDWEALNSRLRNWVVSYQQIIGDCNPDMPSHWLKHRADTGVTTMLESRHEDNPALYGEDHTLTPQGADYMAKLDNLTGVRKQRLRYGRWVAAEGLVYEDEYDPALHLLPNALYPKLRSWRDIPADWTRYWSVDFGHTHPFVLQWWAEDPDGRLFLYREIHHSKRLVEDHARDALLAVTKVVGEVPARDVLSAADIRADVAAGRRQWVEPRPSAIVCDTEDAEGRATLVRHLGMETTAAPKHKGVADTIQAVASRMKPAGDGRPRIFLLRDAVVERDQRRDEAKLPCSTIEEIPGYVWNTSGGRKVKEEPVKDNDDGCDAMRYLVAHRDLGVEVGIRWM
jgi:hypothetical protein